MVITRTPLRISFFGGGTDYPAWYEENGGAVLSTSIDKYCYLSCRYLPQFFDHRSRIAWSQIELVKSRDEIQHPVVREALKFVDMDDGVEIHNFNDLPSRSGMGSSSSFTVGIVHALRVLRGERPDKTQLATDAIHIERNLLRENVGSQDQVAASFGGLNKIIFGGPEHIRVEPVLLDPATLQHLQDHLLLFFTGRSRSASEIAVHQIRNIPNKGNELRTMRRMVDDAIRILQGGALDDFGKLLDESWHIKRGLSSQVTNSSIDEIYETGKKAGAFGGKLLGAGGGGFVLFFVPPERKENVKTKLKALLHVPFRFESCGSQVIYSQLRATEV